MTNFFFEINFDNVIKVVFGGELAGESDKKLSKTDVYDHKVENAVSWLHDRKQDMEAQLTLGAKQIGDYLLQEFFDNDISKVTSQNPRKVISFKRLCKRADLPFPETTLRRFIQVAINFRLLPTEEAKALPPSHHSVLYQVADPNERRRIGIRAAQAGLSVRALRKEVKGKGRRAPGGGRKPKSDFNKDWDRMKNLMKIMADKSEDEAFLEGIDESEMRLELQKVQQLMDKMLGKVAKSKAKNHND